jgi:hypothetical protein
MKPLQLVAFVLIVTSFAFGLSNLMHTYSEGFTTAVMTTDDGAQVHKKLSDSQYGQPVNDEFLIHAPAGKYMLTSNVREWNLIQSGLLGSGLLFLIISSRKRTGRNEKRDS